MNPYEIILNTEKRIREGIQLGEIKRFSPEKTAIYRKGATSPVKIAVQSGVIKFKGKVVLDYGKGKSNDCAFVSKNGGICYIYDFAHCPLLHRAEIDELQIIKRINPESPKGPFDIIILSFVLNVVTKMEREIIAKTTLQLLKHNGVIIIGVREDIVDVQSNWRKFEDGFITSKGTFQSFFYPYEVGLEKLQELFSAMNMTRIGRQTWLISHFSE